LSAYLKELHRKMNSVDLAVGDLEIAGPSSSSTHDNRVVLSAELLSVDVNTDMGVGNEGLGK
jgi:hypothetical protein